MKPAPPDPPEINASLWGKVRPGNIGWDVGANCGQTIPFMRARFETVVAFEPAVECLPFLARYPVDVRAFAVSDVDGTVDLAVLPDKIDTGQLCTFGTVGMEWDLTQPGTDLRTVRCLTLDTLAKSLGPPDFIKVDVEGHEAKVLAGAANLLTEEKPDWLIEFHAPELLEYCQNALHGFGYTTDVVRHPHYARGSTMWHQHGWICARVD